jgi:hypothetical protein
VQSPAQVVQAAGQRRTLAGRTLGQPVLQNGGNIFHKKI